jgi:hypothetical protein
MMKEHRMSECLEENIDKKNAIIISSNRGPVTFRKNTEGEVVISRGSGGLVTALTGIVQDIDATWISCAMTEEDKQWIGGSVPINERGDEIKIKFVSPDKEAFDGYYNEIANPLLWFLQHSMWNLPISPVINRKTWRAWENGYVKVNRLFADAIITQLTRLPSISGRPLSPAIHSAKGAPHHNALYSYSLARTRILGNSTPHDATGYSGGHVCSGCPRFPNQCGCA